MSSYKGVYYGGENYNYDSFNGRDILLCLNLTTMRVIELIPNELDYWTIYQRFVTQQQDSLYIDYYLSHPKNEERNYKTLIKECTLDPKDEWYSNWYRVQNFASYINNTRLRTRNINIRTSDCIPDTLLKNDMYKLLTSYKQ